jgi:hypothetical protein
MLGDVTQKYRGRVFSAWSVPRGYERIREWEFSSLQTMTLTKDRPVLSSERAIHENKTVGVKQ